MWYHLVSIRGMHIVSPPSQSREPDQSVVGAPCLILSLSHHLQSIIYSFLSVNNKLTALTQVNKYLRAHTAQSTHHSFHTWAQSIMTADRTLLDAIKPTITTDHITNHLHSTLPWLTHVTVLHVPKADTLETPQYVLLFTKLAKQKKATGQGEAPATSSPPSSPGSQKKTLTPPRSPNDKAPQPKTNFLRRR